MDHLINQYESSMWNRLINGIENNNTEKVRLSLDEGDLTALFGQTQNHVVLTKPGIFGDELDHVNALQLAILRNKELIALMIIEAVCKNQSTKSRWLNHRCAKGNTALHFAAYQNMSEIIVMLLKAGANPYVKNDQHLRPLDCSYDDEAVHALTSQVRPYSPPASSFSSVLLQKAASHQHHYQALHTPPDTTSTISQDYFDSPPKSTRPRSKESSISIPTPPPSPTTTCDNPTTADNGTRRTRFNLQAIFIDSCMNGDLETVQDALSRGAKINSRHGANDKSPLMIALLNDQENVARLLLSRQDINVNYQDGNGWSALHYAAAMGLWSLLNDLAMKDGVDLYSVNDNNELIEDCPEDRLDRTKCKAIIQRARQVQKNNRKPRRVSANVKP